MLLVVRMKTKNKHSNFNPLNTKIYLLDLKAQFVPRIKHSLPRFYECRTESHEQHFFACELGIADEGECGGGWNQLLCYP